MERLGYGKSLDRHDRVDRSLSGRQWSDRVGNVLGTGIVYDRSWTHACYDLRSDTRTFWYEIWSDVSNAQQNGIRSERNGSSVDRARRTRMFLVRCAGVDRRTGCQRDHHRIDPGMGKSWV